MGVPDQDEQSQPTIPNEWVHCMTLPRELSLKNNRLVQKPVQEPRTLRQNEKNAHISLKQDTEMLDVNQPEKAEILLIPRHVEEGFEISFRGGGPPDLQQNGRSLDFRKEQLC